MDAVGQMHPRTRVVGVLTLVMVLMFGATIGVAVSHSVASHRLLGASHHGSWSSDDDGQHPPVLHTEGDEVETPDAAGHVSGEIISFATPTLLVSLSYDRLAGVQWTPTVARAVLQVWRT